MNLVFLDVGFGSEADTKYRLMLQDAASSAAIPSGLNAQMDCTGCPILSKSF